MHYVTYVQVYGYTPSVVYVGYTPGYYGTVVSASTSTVVYGTGWYSAPVVFARNDGNLTRMEVLLGIGEMQGVLKVLVNGVEIPAGIAGTNNVGTLTIGPSGSAFGTKDRSGQIGLIGGETLAGTLAITNQNGQNGVGFIFSPDFVAITNGTKIFYIDDSGSAQITVIESQ